MYRNEDYKTYSKFASATLKASPLSHRAWNNQGWAWLRAGRKDFAKTCFQRALEIRPDFDMARKNMERYCK